MARETQPSQPPATYAEPLDVDVLIDYPRDHDPLQPKKRLFLFELARCGNITRAASRVQMPRKLHYDWMEGDPEYAGYYQQALECFADNLEHHVFLEAGVLPESETKNALLLMFATKAKRPEYRDNYGTTVNVQNNTLNVTMPKGALSSLRKAQAELIAQRQALLNAPIDAGTTDTITSTGSTSTI